MTTSSSIFQILALYGFEPTYHKQMWWGCGSLVWGKTAYVRRVGRDLYEVKYHIWSYDQDGDPLVDATEVHTFHGALALQFLFEKLFFRPYYKK